MSTSFLARDIASRFHHRGAFVCPEHADIAADLREISTLDLSALKTQFEERKIEILSSFGFNSPPPQNKPFAFAEGTAIIPIQGLLVNRLSWASSYATGYNFIRSQTQAALADPEVKQIVYDVNSSGGLAAGCAELAQEIFDARDQKPSMAVVDSHAYSAAYFLASAAGKVVVTPSGGCGSIGCVAMHMDYSGMLDEAGIKVTMIQAGAEKVDGNPFQRLSARAKASIQQDVDYHYGMFTEAVAQYRDLPVEDIRATEAATYMPPEALDLGLIDAIQTPAEAMAGFISKSGVFGMTAQTSTAGATAVPVAAATPAVATAPTLTQAEISAAVGSAVASALAAERTRQSGIRTCEDAKGREKLAGHLADNTEMSVDSAKAILAVAPKEVAEVAGKAQPSGFAAAMAGTKNPDVGADGAGDGAAADADTPEVRAGRILNSLGRMTGKVIDLKAVKAA